MKALFEAERDANRWPGIFASTAGLMFFGTPFRGAEGMRQSEMLEAALREYEPEQVQEDVLRILKPGDEFLQELVDKFGETRSQANKAHVACFYELKPSNVGAIVGGQARTRFVVSESSGCLDLSDSTEKYSLARTHFNMNKFGKVTEEDYEMVCEVVKRMVAMAPELLLARSRYQGKHSVPSSLKSVLVVNKFVERDAELQRLEDYFHPKTPGHTRRKVFVTYGLGGIGKTQLAIEFARKHHDRYSAVFWLNGSSKDQLRQFFVEVAYRLPRDQVRADVAEALKDSKDIDVDMVVEGVLQWLSLPSNQHWLLVIDNVDRDHLRKEEDSQAYDRYGEGSKIDKVGEKQAKTILENNASKSIKDADLIIERLDGLPLALTQAGSYLRYTNMETTEYIEYYDTTWKNLMKKHDRFPLQEYAYGSVLTTWTISYEQVRSQSEEAANLLRLWGFLDYGDLWYELIASAARLEEETETPDWLIRLAENKLEFLDALQLLSHYSLVDGREETSSHSMHSVLHAWCCQLAEGSERKTLCSLAAGLVVETMPCETEPEYRELWKRLLPHGSRVYRALGEERLEHSHKADEWTVPPRVFFNLGLLFHRNTKLGEAEKMYIRALAGHEKAHGAEHTLTLATVHNLGAIYADQGKQDEAEKMHIRALAGYEKALSAEHISTLDTVSNLGILYAYQGKQDEAEEMYIRALVGKEKAIGIEHISTLGTAGNLGILYTCQGKLEEAEKMLLRVLVGYEMALGIEHISTLRTVDNLGILYADQGKLDKAEKMFIRALAGEEKALGKGDIWTLDTVNNLGLLYRNQGKLDEAEKMYIQALAGREKALGKDHISTLETVFMLGHIYSNQDKLDEAERMFIRALAGREKTLGRDHISTLKTVNMLGYIYSNQDKLDKTEEMYSRALVGKEKALGIEHISTLGTVSSLGRLYADQGKQDEAEKMFIRALVGYEQALGTGHTSTLNTLDNLCALYFDRCY
ncbi:hypothetical protein LTR66_006561 [Elasticomyces elasticus]|nr:hypothetical protein LTR66_006561 [Elasticomyces elasticus]